MLNLLNYTKQLKVNGQLFPNSAAAYEAFKTYEGEVKIELNIADTVADTNTPASSTAAHPSGDLVVQIKVRQYMTQKATSGFDFMRKYNEDKPMPMRVMYGRIVEETKGMYKMELHCRPTPMSICMKCGRTLEHPVSLLYGLGPECGSHFHINPLQSKEELDAAYDQMKASLSEVTWTGWIIKAAIEEWKQVEA